MLTLEEQQQLMQQLTEAKASLNAIQKENTELLAKNIALEEIIANTQQLVEALVNRVEASAARIRELEQQLPSLEGIPDYENLPLYLSRLWRNGFLRAQPSSIQEDRSIISPPLSPAVDINDTSFEGDGAQPSEMPSP
ncbi:MAG: hypothetical protein K0S08_1140 [Gammaproteobacteria bacterium]|jgi:hypothetical protein|nr:hypothetical protein [Gammaproteobacteria bacterium]